MIKEYPKEDRVEYIVPNCPRCGKLMRMQELNLETTETVISLMAICKNGCGSFRPTDLEVAKICSYPLNSISFVDGRGNKL